MTGYRACTGGKVAAMTIDLEIARAAKMKPITEIADKLGIPEDKVLLHGSAYRQDCARSRRDADEKESRQTHPCDRHYADTERGGQDHDDRRAGRCPEQYRQERDDLYPGTFARSGVRHEGRCRRRRARPGGADGADQSAFYRRFSCHCGSQQSAGGDDGQPCVLGQRPGVGCSQN